MKQYLSFAFFLWVILVIPLYFENAYFNMLEAKGHVYVAGAVVILILVLALCILQRNFRDLLPEKKSILDWSVFLLGIIALISCISSGNVWDSLWGIQGWRVGAFTYASFAVLYLFVSRNLNYRQNIWLPVMAVNVLIFVIAVFHSMGIDVLGMHEYIKPEQYYWYISTIGNINWYVGYLCLLVPLIAVFYLEAETAFSRNICFGFMILSCVNMVLCGSDGLYLGVGICAFFAIPYIVSEEKRMQRLFSMLLCYGVVLLFIGFCPLFSDKVSDINGLSAKFLNPMCAGIMAAAGLGGMLLVRGRWRKLSRQQLKAVIIITEIILFVVTGVFLAEMAMNFGDSWGTNRGRTWRYSWEMYRSFPVKEKLIGIGPEMLKESYTELSTHFSRKILVSHSEPMQLLLTTGILGVLCWCGMWGSLIAAYFKERMWKKESIAFALPLTAYLGQSLVNSQQSTNIAMLCVVLVCFRIHERKENSLL